VDPEVVTQFNCLQQTGNFCPSTSNAASPRTSATPSPTTISGSTASSQPLAVDAFFALAGEQGDALASLGTLDLPALANSPLA
jgi:hypothetical protein